MTWDTTLLSRWKSSSFKTLLSHQMENTLQRLQGRFQTMSQELESKNILLLAFFFETQSSDWRYTVRTVITVHKLMETCLWLIATTSGCSTMLIQPTWPQIFVFLWSLIIKYFHEYAEYYQFDVLKSRSLLHDGMIGLTRCLYNMSLHVLKCQVVWY